MKKILAIIFALILVMYGVSFAQDTLDENQVDQLDSTTDSQEITDSNEVESQDDVVDEDSLLQLKAKISTNYRVDLVWQAFEPEEGEELLGYKVTVWQSDSDAKIASFDAETTSAQDWNAKKGINFYQVIAITSEDKYPSNIVQVPMDWNGKYDFALESDKKGLGWKIKKEIKKEVRTELKAEIKLAIDEAVDKVLSGFFAKVDGLSSLEKQKEVLGKVVAAVDVKLSSLAMIHQPRVEYILQSVKQKVQDKLDWLWWENVDSLLEDVLRI